jgi:hypothetical protein
MSEMSERIAKTMWEHWFCSDWPPKRPADLSMDAENFREVAIKVLATMREPTAEMFDAALNKVGYQGGQHAKETWRVMIDTALKD